MIKWNTDDTDATDQNGSPSTLGLQLSVHPSHPFAWHQALSVHIRRIRVIRVRFLVRRRRWVCSYPCIRRIRLPGIRLYPCISVASVSSVFDFLFRVRFLVLLAL
jgi:hypothetical protein